MKISALFEPGDSSGVKVDQMSGPTADWEKAGDSFYRKIKFYEAILDPELELEYHVIAGAVYGGALGISIRPIRAQYADKPQSALPGPRAHPDIPLYSLLQIEHRCL